MRSKLVVCTLAESDTASQLLPVRVKRPLPILPNISSGVSSGPLANGVKLEKEKERISGRVDIHIIIMWCKYVCACTCMCVCVHVSMCVYMHVSMCVYMHVCVHACVCTCMCLYMHVCMCVYMHVCMLTQPAWYTAGLQDSRCHSPHRSLGASTPASTQPCW